MRATPTTRAAEMRATSRAPRPSLARHRSWVNETSRRIEYMRGQLSATLYLVRTRARTMGRIDPFHQKPWVQIDDQFSELAALHPEFSHMVTIVKSVRAVGAEDVLAGSTS